MLQYVNFNDLDKSRQQEFIEETKRIFRRNGFDTSNFFQISRVSLGDASEPYNKIYIENDIELYDETHSPEWAKKENTKILKEKYINEDNEPYADYLGTGYTKKIRNMLTVDETLLPDSIINADLNIGGMKRLIAPALEKMNMFGNKIDDEQKFNQLSSAALYYLCGILCNALKSRTSSPPFNVPKYKKNWDKKRSGYMQKGNLLMEGLKRNV